MFPLSILPPHVNSGHDKSRQEVREHPGRSPTAREVRHLQMPGSPAMFSPSDWGLPPEPPSSAVGQLKEGSVPHQVVCELEAGSHPDSLSPHFGILAVRAAILQGISSHQEGGESGFGGVLSEGFKSGSSFELNLSTLAMVLNCRGPWE